MSEVLGTEVELLSRVNRGIADNGGKMLRPMISLLVARSCGTPGDDSIRYAAASELLHNATLLHDDVADKSSKRRGQPTVNALLGPSDAVLVGDFWLAKSVCAIMATRNYKEIAELFSKTLTDLAEGEMFQLQKAGTADTDFKDYEKIIFCKTASLFVSAAVSAAVSVKAPEEYVEAAKEYAGCFGMAFQIKDDILDYSGGDELGKPVGIDIREKKITLPLLCALENSPREKEIRSKVALAAEDESVVDEIRNFVLENDGTLKAAKILDTYVDRAVNAIKKLPASEARDYLCDVARYNSIREQ